MTLFAPPLPSLFFKPQRYRPHGVGYWSGHIPFACDLAYTLRPSLFVELGTHTGESYFAFCQALQEAGVDARSFAVDTWRGDQHTGAYGDEVFEEVTACNLPYKHFSSLLRMTFDEALTGFHEGSIDLLHIDGAHTYEAVKHDFESWWPKVKAGGVIVMHDSHERSHDFGVWRLLEELKELYPADEFVHSHGLGVICKPPLRVESHVASAFVTTGEAERNAIRRYYEVCAGNLKNEFLASRSSADWDVVSQLFWANPGESFDERNSVRASHVVGAGISHVLLPLPANISPTSNLRLQPTLTPALLALKSVALIGKSGEALWTQTASSCGTEWQKQGFVADQAEELLLVGSPEQTAFTLDLQARARQQLSDAIAVRLELRGYAPQPFAAAVARASKTEPAKKSSRWLFGR